ncbi:FGGY-family carbohydrate kinase [Pseudonocardia kunmingensis]|uniref:Xylulokinase n=1 Tax=Pseudonocardia kunmingensis TaxID=630975 RepID=A0A543CYH5_9PSEU|nr:FGGY family carbohydrate kinase [Pseudonocardia kunmingensis]TQM02156.1 xylulokinase [Pseudonocardia kunmingensis]
MRFIGVDIGTSSSKGVVVDAAGSVLATHTRPHVTSSPHPGWFEHDADEVWWAAVTTILRALLRESPGPVDGVAVSGIGPAVLLTDAEDRPLRPAILYGIDTRAEREIAAQNERFGSDVLLTSVGNLLTSQAVGPKLAWVAAHEPESFARTRRIYSAPGWIVRRLTGAYVLDHYSASGSDPLYELRARGWWEPGWAGLDRLERPQLAWPGEVVGTITREAADATGLPSGTPVLAGTVDALAEAYSVGCRAPGDTMLMYGSTMFVIQTVSEPVAHPGLWAAVGRTAGTFSSAAGMSTSGLITSWLAAATGNGFADLLAEARQVPAGSDGLLLLPYFAGERTPIFDPRARGAWVGLTLRHGRGHLYRSVLEAVGFGVRHNLAAMAAAGATPQRLVAVGGGTRDDLWAQIVSDVLGLPQDIPSVTVGAAYGDARMAADAAGVDTTGWNPVARHARPDPAVRDVYDVLYGEYLRTYPALADTMHVLAELEARGRGTTASR